MRAGMRLKLQLKEKDEALDEFLARPMMSPRLHVMMPRLEIRPPQKRGSGASHATAKRRSIQRVELPLMNS